MLKNSNMTMKELAAQRLNRVLDFSNESQLYIPQLRWKTKQHGTEIVGYTDITCNDDFVKIWASDLENKKNDINGPESERIILGDLTKREPQFDLL